MDDRTLPAGMTSAVGASGAGRSQPSVVVTITAAHVELVWQ
jgi:hypothetical protein